MVPHTPRRKRIVDRFIPAREGVNLQAAYNLALTDDTTSNDSDGTYTALLRAELFSDVPGSGASAGRLSHENSGLDSSPIGSSSIGGSTRSSPDRILRGFRSVPTTPKRRRDEITPKSVFSYSPGRSVTSNYTENGDDPSIVRPESQQLLLRPRRQQRHVDSMPYKVLDAPELADDFYLNLLHWGPDNRLAVGLGNIVYMWDAASGDVQQLAQLGAGESVASVQWMPSGEYVAVGTSRGAVQIWNAETSQRTRMMAGHRDRAAALGWNSHILSSGSRDSTLLHRDVRIPAPFIERVEGHHGEICGLKWNTDMDQLATGSNENQLMVWQGVGSQPLYSFTEHKAAVKAISWSPHQRGLLASGGGTNDGHIWFWNTLTGRPVQSRNTGSQVCGLEWSRTTRELVSTHGYRDNHIRIWRYPSMSPVATLRGHALRVLYLSMSPDGSSIVTGAGDETLRLWRVFDVGSHSSSNLAMSAQLR